MAGPAELVHGKMFIGLILNVLLFGINVTQTYFYYIHSKRDRLRIKIWVIIVFLADLIQALFGFLYLYQTLVVHFGDVAQLLTANNVFAVVPTMTGLTATIVQLFFAWRIRILTNNWYYVAFVIAAAVLGGVCAIVVAYEGGLTPHFADFRHFKVVAIVGFVSEMLADIMITSILVWFLFACCIRHKHRSGFQQSDKMVDRIIRVTMQTGLMTLIFAGLSMLFFLLNPGGTYLLLHFVLSKLYSSSLLSSLNSRQGWGYDASESTEGHFDFSLRFSSNSKVDKTSNVLVATLLESEEGPSIELGLQAVNNVTK